MKKKNLKKAKFSANEVVEKFFKNLKEVKATLKGCEENYNYYTFNYSLLKSRKENRAGIDEKRVKYYIQQIIDGRFDFQMGFVYAQKEGCLINDGTHKRIACERMGMPVKFTITCAKSIVEVSHYNSGTKPNWERNDSFGSAKTLGVEVCYLLEELRDKNCILHNVPTKAISTNILYGLLTENTKFFGGGVNTPKLENWLDETLLSKAKKRTFKKTLERFTYLANELKNNQRSYKIRKAVMDLHFDDNVLFDLEVFCESFKYEGFIIEIDKVEIIKEQAIATYKRQIRRNVKSEKANSLAA